MRLDAGFYCGSGAETRQLLTQSGLTTEPLGKLASVDQPTVFGKRFMQGSRERGVPLYAASELLNHVPETDSFLAESFAPQFACLMAQPGTLLLSRSGSVGRAVLVPPWMSGIAIQDDILKITTNNPDIARYLYAYSVSPIGKPILADAAFGSVIQHIKVDHIRQVPVIVPHRDILSRISNLMKAAEEVRGQSRILLQQVEQGILTLNSLPHLPPVKDDVETYAITGYMVTSPSGNASEHRLDAHFYNPTAQQAVANIRKCREVKTVGEVARRVFFCNRFTRTFVDSEHGVPYLAGKNIVQMRPTDLAYLSKSQTVDFEQYRLQRGWILMTCSGTIGRTCMVWKNFEEYVGTHDLIRLVPDEQRIDGGYLYAFLSSDYGKQQVLRYRHGSVIDHVTPEQVQQVLIPLPSRREQTAIGDKVRDAYDKRAEAIRLEDEAQAILMKELTKVPGSKGV